MKTTRLIVGIIVLIIGFMMMILGFFLRSTPWIGIPIFFVGTIGVSSIAPILLTPYDPQDW
jgi:hypothetical protein